MTLCCLQEKNFDRASYFVQKALKIDQYNPLALRYARELNIATEEKKAVKNNTVDTTTVKRTDATPSVPTYRRQTRQNNLKNEIIAFFIGGVSIAIVLLSLVMPALSEEKDKIIDDLRSKVSSASTNITPEELVELRQRTEALEQENEKYKSEALKQQNVTLLQEATALAEQDNVIDAANKIVLIDSSSFSEQEKAELNTLKINVLPQAASNLYTQGRNEFLNKNYDTAKEHLENCLKYAYSEDFIDDTFYYLGQIAQEKNDMDTAKQYYQRILNEHPDSNQSANAQNALEQINTVAPEQQSEQQPDENIQ